MYPRGIYLPKVAFEEKIAPTVNRRGGLVKTSPRDTIIGNLKKVPIFFYFFQDLDLM